jgi:diguanylate cyclase (GGDEF)-like protein
MNYPSYGNALLHGPEFPASVQHCGPVHGHIDVGQAPHAHPSRWNNKLIPAAVLLVGVVLSVIASQSASEETSRNAQLRFDTAAANATTQIERRFAAYFEVLAGIRALFHTVDKVSREDFHRYTEALALERNFPGFQILNYAPYVAAGSKEAFENTVRQDPALPSGVRFAITPPGARDGYHPLTLVEPLAKNLEYLGKDIAARPAVRATLELARDTGKLASSAMVFQPPGQTEKIALSVRMPAYRVGMPIDTVEQRRAAYLGSVGAGFWMGETLADLPGVPNGIRLRVFDAGTEATTPDPGSATAALPDKLLFDTSTSRAGTQSAKPQPVAASDLLRRQQFELAGRVWMVEVSAPLAGDVEPLERMLPAILLVAWCVSSALLAGILFSLTGSQRRATALAHDMTRSLRLAHDIARELAGDVEPESAVAFILSSIGTQLGWHAAVCWGLGEDGQVRSLGAWAVADDAASQAFVTAMREFSEPRRGSDHHLEAAWITGNPMWRAIGVEAGPRCDLIAGRYGLNAAVVIPVIAGTQLVALEFFSRARIAVDRETEGFMRSVANQLAQYLRRKQAETALRYAANHDALTGLAARPLLHELVTHAIQRAEREHNKVAVLFMDLDRFKHINDSLGHSAGDLLLRICADRLRECVRACDTVARFGGDEFVLVVEGLHSTADVITLLTKVLSRFRVPFDVNGRELRTTASIGISMFPDDGIDVETLLMNADAAMYQAKAKGPGNHQFYSAQMNMQGQERLALESALPLAIERGELFLVYQPKLSIATGRITGVEALMRWHHPTLGLISPLQFIPMAEDTGLIDSFGHWALETACHDARKWQDQGHPVQVSVNLSARQLDRPRLAEEVARVLADVRLAPANLELEVTESCVMRNPAQAAERLQELRDLGVSLAIDDFGTGYSSLSHLRTFPLCTLKIDRSFVKDLPADEDAANLAAGIIALAHRLRMKVVAEGVETLEQLAHLRANGCDEFQGYYLSRPIPANEMSLLLERDLRHFVSPTVAAQAVTVGF